MGLDMYLKAERPGSAHATTELAYWRKHNALHAWFMREWRKANPGSSSDDFNCARFDLSLDKITALESAIKNSQLRPQAGFFWGSVDYDPAEDREYDLEALADARAAIASGAVVYYTADW